MSATDCSGSVATTGDAVSMIGGVLLFMQSRKTKRKVGSVLVVLLLVNSYLGWKKINIVLLLMHLGLLNI